MAAYVGQQPVDVLTGLALGWAVAAFAGAWIAARFAGRGEWPGPVVGMLFLVATCTNFALIPHPMWMMTLAVIAIIGATWLGALFGATPRGPRRPKGESQRFCVTP